jgi:hypothetical protein
MVFVEVSNVMTAKYKILKRRHEVNIKDEWQVDVVRTTESKDGSISVQLPTFVLPESLGILNSDHALETVRKIAGVPASILSVALWNEFRNDYFDSIVYC